MTRFSVTWEGICREENLSPSQIVELLEEETSELRTFQMNSIHSLAIMCDELEDDPPKDSSPPDTVRMYPIRIIFLFGDGRPIVLVRSIHFYFLLTSNSDKL